MQHFAHLAQRLFNVPLLIHPDKAEIIIAALSERLGITQMVRINGDVVMGGFAEDAEFTSRGNNPRDAGYDLVDGVAVIPVQGTLVNKLGTLRPWSGMTGYDGIRQNFLTALNASDVRAIALDIESPGGEASGVFDLADLIYDARGEKPIWAILTEHAYSSAYAIASAADRIMVPRTGGAGSIGAYYMHVDYSGALDKEGIKVTFIKYGERKLDGHPTLPLSKEAAAKIQADIDAVGDLFVETVARNRKLSAKKVRATEAATILAAASVKLGLADSVMSPDAAFRTLISSL